MSTTETILLIILTIILSLQVILGLVLIATSIKLVSEVRQIVQKADHVVDTVESAAEAFKDTTGKLAIMKMIKNIANMVQRSSK